MSAAIISYTLLGTHSAYCTPQRELFRLCRHATKNMHTMYIYLQRYTDMHTQTHDTHTHQNLHRIWQKVLSAFRAQKWFEVCWAPMCCAVKMLFRCVAFPDSLCRFVFHWRNLDFVSAEVQFGRGRTHTISLHMESLIVSLNCTPVLRCHHCSAVGSKRVANDL